MEETISTITRTAVSFVFLLIITNMFGKQINSHKNHFNFAMAITVGSLVANMGFNINLHFWPMLWSFFTLVLIYYAAATISFRSIKLQRLISGKPILLIEDGKALTGNLRKTKYTIENLYQQLREKDIFDIKIVKRGILETSGNLSIQKVEYLPKALGIYLPNHLFQEIHVPQEVILNGSYPSSEPVPRSFYDWLETELKKRGLSTENIRYAAASSDHFIYCFLF